MWKDRSSGWEGGLIGGGFYIAEKRNSGCICYGCQLMKIQRTEIVRGLLKET